MKYLTDELKEYAQSDYYPFHMPGHKRKSLSFPNPYEIDITEIDGFDNLHHATGIIKWKYMRSAGCDQRGYKAWRQGAGCEKLSQSGVPCIIYE